MSFLTQSHQVLFGRPLCQTDVIVCQTKFWFSVIVQCICLLRHGLQYLDNVVCWTLGKSGAVKKISLLLWRYQNYIY